MIKDYDGIESDYLVCALIKDSTIIKQNLINPLVARFFQFQEIEKYEELSIEYGFSDIDFPRIGFDRIYNTLLSVIKREDNIIDVPVKYFLTLDKINCSQKCKKTDIYYDTIEINDRPFLYFIYIDLIEIIQELRKPRINL
ncbi:MAG: hypothetical protein RLZZ352_2886 [Pseudomonadota bacterium]